MPAHTSIYHKHDVDCGDLTSFKYPQTLHMQWRICRCAMPHHLCTLLYVGVSIEQHNVKRLQLEWEPSLTWSWTNTLLSSLHFPVNWTHVNHNGAICQCLVAPLKITIIPGKRMCTVYTLLASKIFHQPVNVWGKRLQAAYVDLQRNLRVIRALSF